MEVFAALKKPHRTRRHRKTKKPQRRHLHIEIAVALLALVMILYHLVFVLVFILFLLILFFYTKKIFINRKNRSKKKNYTIEKIDLMTGIEFERLVLDYYQAHGWQLRMTKTTGDFGADLVGLDPRGNKWVIQAKRYHGNVSLSAVQEVYSSLLMYGAKRGMVITNSYFTKAAIEMAQKAGILMIDRTKLIDMMRHF